MSEMKYEFRQQTITFLGYGMDKNDMRPQKARIYVLKSLKQLRDKKELTATVH